MSLDSILNKITGDARAEAESVLSESRERAEAIRESADEEAGAAAEALLKERRRQADLEAGRLVTAARLDGKLRILRAKQDLIEEVLDDAFREVLQSASGLKRTVVLKDGERKEDLDAARLREDLRPELEPLVVEQLKL